MQQSELQALGQHIQARLQQLPSPIRLRIRCAFREEALLVLAEHLLHVEPSPRQTFSTVADALQECTPELMKSGWVRSGIGGTKFLPVRIYLRVAGYQQPYDSFVFSLKPSAPPTSTTPPIPTFVPPAVVAPLEPVTRLEKQVELENIEAPPVAEVKSAREIEPATEPPVEPETVEPEISVVAPVSEVAPVAEVESITEPELVVETEIVEEIEIVEDQPEFLADPIAQIAPTTEPPVEPETVEPEISIVAPVAEVTSVAEVESITEPEPIAEIEIVEEQPQLLADPIAQIAPTTEPAVEPETVEPEISEVAPVAEVESITEPEPVAEIEIVEEIEIIEEQPEFLADPIAQIAPATEPAAVLETSDPQTDWVLDRGIAEVGSVEMAELEPVTPEIAINEPVFAESVDFEELPELEEPILEHISELPLAEEAIAESPSIAPENLSVEPDATTDSSLSEEAPLDLEEITLLPGDTFVPAAIASTASNDSPPVEQISPSQNETQDEPDLDVGLQTEPVGIEPSPATFSEPISSVHIGTLDPQPTIQPTTPNRFLESLGLADAKLLDPENLTDLQEGSRVDAETLELFNAVELNPISPESTLDSELKAPPEPENLSTEYIPPSEEIVTIESAIAEKPHTDELSTHAENSTPPIFTASLAPEDSATQPSSQPIRARQFSSSSIMIGTAIGLFGLLGGWYLVSRPCVLGSSCEPLQKAQGISQAAFQTVQTTESAIAIAQAYDDLGTANTLLKSIPVWSGQHQAAQTLLADNDAKSTAIGQLVRTLKKGNEAANRSQNPPHPLPEWREIQRLWRESIVALEKVPSNTAIYPVAQRKINEYRTNLEGINKRVVVEQQAQEEVDNAKKTAQLAETRTGIATSAEGWREVYTSWQAAIDFLKNVPNGAAARLEAEELLKIYQTKLTAAGTRRDQENTAITAYTEAIAQAERAQSFQQKNQWENAIAAWESALANGQKVAQDTTPYAQAQSLIATYQTALTQAQGGLQVSEAIQAAKPALDRTCNGTPKVCQYDAAPTAIRVQITYGYDQMVETAMTNAQAQGNSTAQAGVVSQVNTFLQELALISQTAQVPIDLYNANGSKFGTYSPDASGFIPQ